MPDCGAAFTIRRADNQDAGGILTVQRAAFLSEAMIYVDLSLPPLVETVTELRADLMTCLALVACTTQERVVGSVRLRERGRVGEIRRLAVAPDLQGNGIGRSLLEAIEAAAPLAVERFELFTGHLSETNIRFYEGSGYQETCRRHTEQGPILVFMSKHRAP